MINLDTTDLQILCALRDDSRLSLRELGAKISLSAPAVASRVKRLE
ncbi:MAG: Lrp/AsnC family transcriptional regulator, partial [Succinivibrio sp.]